MVVAGSLMRFRRLDAEQRRQLLRASFWLTVCSFAVAAMPFRTAIRLGSIPCAPRAGPAETILWAIGAAARRLPWRTMCIEKGLAAQRMLRADGVDALLHYGARHDPDTGKLQAHVWVTVDGRAVVGGEEAQGFAPVATYP
jgi:hypothetical protein